MVIVYAGWVAAGFLLAAIASTASAQTPTSRLTIQGPAEKSAGPIPRDSLGRPCLDVEAGARRQMVNPDVLDHVVSLKNICLRKVKVRVCYINSDRCKEVELLSNKREDVTLGAMKGIGYFRYSLTYISR